MCLSCASWQKLYGSVVGPISLQKQLEDKMKSASMYDDWREAASALDDVQGNDRWKAIDASPDYDYELIQNRLSQLRVARKENDLNALTFLLRTSIMRSGCCSSNFLVIRYQSNHWRHK
jgi:hypothetical protein